MAKRGKANRAQRFRAQRDRALARADHFAAMLIAVALQNGGEVTVTHEQGAAATVALSSGRVSLDVDEQGTRLRVKPAPQEEDQ